MTSNYYCRSLFLAGLLLLVMGLSGCRPWQQSFYPVGIYSVHNTNDLPEIKAAGFNIVNGPESKAFLNAAQAEGIKVFAWPGTSAGPSFDPDKALRVMREVDGHPALWAWYLVDEPDLNRIAPWEVRKMHQFFKENRAKTPTAQVLYKGAQAPFFAPITDLVLVDRYPIPWQPLASFNQHVRQVRLAAGPSRKVAAIIQAFDWTYWPELMPGEKNLRPPTHQELRCMAYGALAEGVNGIFFYAFEESKWKIREHPEVWEAVKKVVAEINRNLPLFQAERLWWPYSATFREWEKRFNGTLESSLQPVLLKVATGNRQVAPGYYLLIINTTEHTLGYRITLPGPCYGLVETVGEYHSCYIQNYWLEDEFAPYAARIYGPLPLSEAERHAIHQP